MSETNPKFMERALQLALAGKGSVAPNPLVGAVLVHSGRIIGEGFHQFFGGPHAEPNCFNSVQAEYRRLIPESTLYVTLEPCAHYGKTPPCTERIIAEGVKKVVVCNVDPFTKVSGRGVQRLRDAGIEVQTDVLNATGRWVNRRFFCAQEHARPYIILKWAQTETGFFAPANGLRLQLSNYLTRVINHTWRRAEGAIMVGTNTALADNPRLTSDGTGKQPLRVVLDQALKVQPGAHLLDGSAPTLVFNATTTETRENVEYVAVNFDNSLLTTMLQHLLQRGVQSLIVEGGAQLLQSFIDAGLWDEARLFVTPSERLTQGLAAPTLIANRKILEADLGDNILQIHVAEKNRYYNSELLNSFLTA